MNADKHIDMFIGNWFNFVSTFYYLIVILSQIIRRAYKEHFLVNKIMLLMEFGSPRFGKIWTLKLNWIL